MADAFDGVFLWRSVVHHASHTQVSVIRCMVFLHSREGRPWSGREVGRILIERCVTLVLEMWFLFRDTILKLGMTEGISKHRAPEILFSLAFIWNTCEFQFLHKLLVVSGCWCGR